jgi:hypothetical protein
MGQNKADAFCEKPCATIWYYIPIIFPYSFALVARKITTNLQHFYITYQFSCVSFGTIHFYLTMLKSEKENFYEIYIILFITLDRLIKKLHTDNYRKIVCYELNSKYNFLYNI